jgi:histidinol-phosphatase
MNPWDNAALVPCVREAGGLVTSIDGDAQDVVWKANLVASASNALHEQVLRALRKT